MEQSFWLERWKMQQIGFHQSQINPYLKQYWGVLNLPKNAEVFVPLCGKSLDLLWLCEMGHHVFGVELSDIAAQDFFKEQDLMPSVSQLGAFKCYQIGRLTMYVGDYFSLVPDMLKSSQAIYDRAALIALPEDMRGCYVDKQKELFGRGVPQLLITLEYPQAQMSGPPFSVTSVEVNARYASSYDIRLLHDKNVLDDNLHLKNKGLYSLQEAVYALSPKSHDVYS